MTLQDDLRDLGCELPAEIIEALLPYQREALEEAVHREHALRERWVAVRPVGVPNPTRTNDTAQPPAEATA